MWARMVFHKVTTTYLPAVRSWNALPNDVALPVYVTKNGHTLAVCKEPLIEETCADVHFLTSKGIESACLFCVNSLTCSINKRKRGDVFTPEEKLRLQAWNEHYYKMLSTSTEIPLLALYPDLSNKLSGKAFEIEFISEIYEMEFNLQRILQNIDILMQADAHTLAKYQTIEDYTKVLSNDSEFRVKLKRLAKLLQKYSQEEFDTAIATMAL